MASEIELPWAAQEGKSAVPQNSRETLHNMFAEMEVSGRKQIVRRQRAGLARVYALGGEKRAVERHNDLHYVIVNATLYSFDGVVLTTLGTLSTSTGRCQIIFGDNEQIGVCDGSTVYVYEDAALAAVAMPDDQEVATVAYQGGFGLYAIKDSDRFYCTAPGDLATVDALDFATAEGYSDATRRVFVDHNEVWLFGVRSTEIWQLSGGTDFPFAPFPNAQLERGCSAAFSVVAEDNTVFWMGDDGVVYRAEGYRPQRVSTHPIERAITALSTAQIASCDAFVYTDHGHKFVTFRFPNALTLQYNLATGLWNRADTYGSPDWQVVGSAGHAADYVLTSGAICALRRGLNTDEGGIMRRGGVGAPGDANGRRLSIHEFRLDCEVGRAASGVTPMVMMRFAPDGETFGNIRTRSLGLEGKYNQRVTWRQLGMGRRPTIEVFITDDAEFSIMSTFARASAMLT